MRVLSVKLPDDLDEKLAEAARRRKSGKSAIIREAIEAFTDAGKRSVTSAAGKLVGSLDGSPDLSTSPTHMSGYGE